MYQSAALELWNLTPGVPVFVGAQGVFNVLGRLKSPHQVKALFYSLNGSPEKPGFFKYATKESLRLERAGDFNIDTIKACELQTDNSLLLRTITVGSQQEKYLVNFPLSAYAQEQSHFKLKLEGVKYPQQVGQVADGKWRVDRDESGEPCLEIKKEDAGYDRIILFGSREWTCGYEITARLCVTAWTGIQDHGLGVAFKWNPHLQGDGTCLPAEWNTGVGMYYATTASLRVMGLRVAFGVTSSNGTGAKFHHYLLEHKPLSLWRNELTRISKRIFGANRVLPQIPPNKQYRFRMVVRPERYALTVWPNEKREPLPQLNLPQPMDRLPEGSVGIIAHHCAVRVYDFQVSPVSLVEETPA